MKAHANAKFEAMERLKVVFEMPLSSGLMLWLKVWTFWNLLFFLCA